MMKRIRPDDYEKFTCMADRCPITCCQEWKIAVDADTNRKWEKMLPPVDTEPQRKNLSAYTIKKDGGHVIELNEAHQCPFLSGNKLCKLVISYGEKILSETCAVFPREIHCFETHEEEMLMPCCPAVVDLLRDGKPQILSVDEPGLFYIRRKVTEMFLYDQYSVEETMLSAFYIVTELLREQREASLEDYFSEENQKQLRESVRDVTSNPAATMEERNELLQDLAVNYRKEGLYLGYLNPILTKAEELSGRYEDVTKEMMKQFEKEFMPFAPLMKNFIVNELNSDLVTPGANMENMVVRFQWIAIEYGAIKHSIFLKWILDGQKKIAYETVRDYIVVICRMTGYDEEDIYEYLENSFEKLIWDWGYFALVVGNRTA